MTPRGLPRRLFDTFLSPGSLFTELRDRPVWFGALAVSATISAATMLAIPADVFADLVRQSLQDAGVDVPRNLDFAAGITRFTTVLFAVVGVAVWAFGGSALFSFLFAFVFGDEGTYTQYLSVTSHALIVTTLGAVVTLPLKVTQMDLQLTLSLGTFALFLEDGYWLSFLNLMDLFVIWSLVLVALGASVIDEKRRWGSATAVVVGTWAVVSLVLAAFIP